jgi:4-diphosphocytidyl-2-C-methyl-D-erythritol kinase
MEALARAKANLALAVLGRRADGFHDLVSVFVRLDLADRVTVEVASGGADRLAAHGPVAYQPRADDLVLRAASELRKAHRPDAPGLAFGLEKHIPLGAGLGGGSADAAAALGLAAAAWSLDLSAAERLALATRLGSDVPFMAADVDAALVTGRGEHVEALSGPQGAIGVVLVTAGPSMATRDVFAAWDAAGEGGRPGTAGASSDRARGLAAQLAAGCSAADLAGMAVALHDANDLWPIAARLRPELPALRAAIETRLDRPVLLSGSGPTLLALYPSPTAAASAAADLGARPIDGVEPRAVRVASIGA